MAAVPPVAAPGLKVFTALLTPKSPCEPFTTKMVIIRASTTMDSISMKIRVLFTLMSMPR